MHLKNLMVTVTTIAMLVLLSGSTMAALWKVKGVVTDKASGEAIKDVQLSFKDMEMGREFKTKTNAKGEYLYQLPWGTYHLKVKAEGYMPQEILELKPSGVEGGDEVTKNFVLEKGKGYLASELSPEEKAKLEAEAAKFEGQKEEIKKRQEAAGMVMQLFEEGKLAETNGRYDQAIEKFQQALVADPKQPNIIAHMAECLSRKGNVDEAITEYKKAIELSPNDSALRVNLGAIYARKGMSTEAQAEFDKVAAADPSNAHLAFYNVGVIMLNGGKNDEAIAAFQKSIELNAKFANAYYQLSTCLINKGDYKAGVSALETYLKLDPNGPNAETAKQMLPELKKLVN